MVNEQRRLNSGMFGGPGGRVGGRPHGCKNKLTITVREAVLKAFNALQEDEDNNLIAWGKKNPGDFYKIAAKLIPTEIVANVRNVITVGVKPVSTLPANVQNSIEDIEHEEVDDFETGL